MTDLELEAITAGIADELRRRYPELEIVRHKLQARGYGLVMATPLYCREFWVKVTAFGVLVDVEKDVNNGFLRRLAQISYDDPKMLEKVFEVIDKLMDQGQVA